MTTALFVKPGNAIRIPKKPVTFDTLNILSKKNIDKCTGIISHIKKMIMVLKQHKQI